MKKRKENYFEKDFFKLMNNEVIRKAMENVRKHGHIKLLTTDERTHQLVLEPKYHAKKKFFGSFSRNRMNEIDEFINKPMYLDLSILQRCIYQ